MIYLKPYMKGLRSTRFLKAETPMKVRNDYSRIPTGSTVLNWGKSSGDTRHLCQINPQQYSSIICNKIKFGDARFSDAVEFTTNITEAREWAAEQGEKVMCRTLISSHSGRGIVVARNPDQIVEAPLYSRYFRKQREYRVYVGWAVDDQGFNSGILVTYAASKRNPQTEQVVDRDSLLIRSSEQGWVYQTENPTALPFAVDDAICSFTCELVDKTHDDSLTSYGWLLALDILYREGEAKIVEANLAPGLSETTAPRVYELAQFINEGLS